jgi:uncharacterized protein (TIGR02145 family)
MHISQNIIPLFCKFFLVVALIFLQTFLFAQNSAPLVSNVYFTQKTDGTGIVDIYYDLTDDHNAGISITMLISNDAGSSWGIIPTQTTGDIGEGIIQGAGKHIIWYAVNEDYNLEESNQYRFKIIADDTILLTDWDGNVYETIWVGEELWMADNLNASHYRNGVEIPHVTSNGTWGATTAGAYCYFNNDAAYGEEYGKLYNWYATVDGNGVCPEGWHVPTHGEWEALATFFGGICSGGNGINETCTLIGGKLKETGTDHWHNPNTGATNEIGFTGLPGGNRSHTGSPFYAHWYGSNYGTVLGYFGQMWSSTSYSGDGAYAMDMRYTTTSSYWMPIYKRAGLSLRCKQD